jgi:hypothetical protein
MRNRRSTLLPLLRGGLLPLAVLLGAGAAAAPPSDPVHLGPAIPEAADPFGQRARIDGARMLEDQATLAHDSMEGRRTGTPGIERARRFLDRTMEDRGMGLVDGSRTRSFEFVGRQDSVVYEGVNFHALVPGSVHPERFIVVTAHYDHLGIQGGEIFNGADDNASGTAAILALADWFGRHLPRHSLLFVAFDAEEMGLQGARAFIEDPPVPLDRVVMNVNLDMVSRSEEGELYAAGTYHYPFLVPLVEDVAAVSAISLLTGHDRPDLPPGEDWTMASDHGPFHQAGIPFLYFGVEDHPGYHAPSDVVEDVTPEFYIEAVETVLDFLLLADRRGELIMDARSGGRR